MMTESEDQYGPVGDIPSLAVANTEYTILDTTRLRRGGFTLELAQFATRRSAGYIKRAWLTVFADQALSFYHRHLCGTIAAPVVGDWDAVLDENDASPTPISANTLYIIPVHLFGDDHWLVLKTGVTPPTVKKISVRYSIDQAIAE